MVKKFARSAAGQEEQLPSDLRPPRILNVCDNVIPQHAYLANRA